MNEKEIKVEAKKPDAILTALRSAVMWVEDNVKVVFAFVLAFLVIGAGVSTYSHFQKKNEGEYQEAYYKAEKAYLAKKATVKEPKDIQADYGDVVTQFEAVLKTHPQSKAAQMAALNLSEIYNSYKMQDQAIAALSQIQAYLKSGELVASLVKNQMGNLFADKNDCKTALTHWNQVVSDKKVEFLHDEVMLRQALCHEQMGEFAQAETLYSKLSTAKPESVLGKTAEKYSRNLKNKKANPASGT